MAYYDSVPVRKRAKYPTLTLLHVGPVRVTLLNGKADWREYVVWQLGLLVSSLVLLAILQLLWHPGTVADLTALYLLLATVPAIVIAAISLWWLIKREYSRSKRFALAFLILSDLTAALAALGTFRTVSGEWWFEWLLAGTLAYLIGTGIIGMIILVRGDDVSPWWR